MKKVNGKNLTNRRGGGGAVVFIILGIIIIAALVIIFIIKPFGGGTGFGGAGDGSSGDASASDVSAPDAVSNIAVIRVDGNDIYLDNEPCADAEELKQRITESDTGKEYELDHSTAIKSTYDEVKQVLSELEDALDIKVNYNE